MSKKNIVFLLVCVFQVVVLAEPLTLTQNFSVPGDLFMRIDESTLAEATKTPAFDVTPTGWTWGGYADSSTGYRVEIDQNTRNTVVFDELIFKLNPNNDYAYTIFSSTGTNVPDTFVDISGAGASINFKISDIWNGWFGGGDNGSGLPEPQNEVRATVLRAMIRDGNGDWFMSDLFCPSTYEQGDLDGTVAEYSFPCDGSSWRKLSQTEIDNLNALASGDEIPLDRDPNVTDLPDLTAVSGLGVYVWNTYDNSNGQLAFTEISITGEGHNIVLEKLGQVFDKSSTNTYMIDGYSVYPTMEPETPQKPNFTTTSTGWKWGGYSAPNALSVQISDNAGGGGELLFKTYGTSTADPMITGSYAYTIFDSKGGNIADSYIDVSGRNGAMELKISDIWDGWFGGGDNGSGLPGVASEIRATVLRAMIRDYDGNWYCSDLFCPSTYESTYPYGITYDFLFDGITWYQYSQAEQDNLNALAGADEIALTKDPAPAATAPDLTKVTGMGIYVWNQFCIISGTLGFNEISLKGPSVFVAPKYWDEDELADMASEWLVSEIAWQESMDTDPVTNGGWIMRGGITGDYIVSGGQMLLLGNSYGNWRMDTVPSYRFPSQTIVNTRMMASTVSDTTEGSRSGINFWINVDSEAYPDSYGGINYNVVLDGSNNQYVEFISNWTAGVAWPPASYMRVTGDGTTNFDDSMLDITLTIKPTEPNEVNPTPTTIDVDYVIADQSGTTATGGFVMNRRTGTIDYQVATILTGGAQGIIDSINIQGSYDALTDRTEDGFVDFLDFAWLADRWMTVRDVPWP